MVFGLVVANSAMIKLICFRYKQQKNGHNFLCYTRLIVRKNYPDLLEISSIIFYISFFS